MGGATPLAQVCLRSGNGTKATVGEGLATPAWEAVQGGSDGMPLRASPARAARRSRTDSSRGPGAQIASGLRVVPKGSCIAYPAPSSGRQRAQVLLPGHCRVGGGGRGGRRKGEEKGGSQEGWEASGDSPAAPGASGWSGRRLLRAAARGQAVPEAAGAGEVFGVFPGLYSSRGSPSLGWAEVCRCAASLRSYGMLPPPPATPTP